jgi:hypothetical protein
MDKTLIPAIPENIQILPEIPEEIISSFLISVLEVFTKTENEDVRIWGSQKKGFSRYWDRTSDLLLKF